MKTTNLSFAALLLLSALSGSLPRANAQGGIPLWTNHYNEWNGDASPHAVATDSTGNVFVTGVLHTGDGRSSNSCATVAYSSVGVPLWTNHINEESGWGNAVVVGNGKVFITGGSWNGTDNDFRTIAYSTSGAPLWTNLYDALDADAATAIAVDTNGDVVVTGPSVLGSWDYVTIKYAGDGAPLWTNRYDGGNSYEVPSALALDASGNVFVTGSSEAAGNHDFETVAYSSDGTPLWTARYDGPGNSDDQAFGLAVDSQGNVLVSGYSAGELAVIKYSSTGQPRWTNQTSGGYYSRIVVDSSDNAFVASGGVTVKYSSECKPLWTNLYAGGANAVAVDGRGNVFVTGRSVEGTNKWCMTVAYSSAGEPLWTNRYSRMGDASGFAMTVDETGNVIVTGQSWNGTNYDFTTIKYSATVPPVRLTLEPDSSGGYFVRFNGMAGASYRLQRATSIKGPWTTSAPQTAPASGRVEFHDLFPPAGRAFYRTVQP